MREALLKALEAGFGRHAFEIGGQSGMVAVFRAAHPEVGDVAIWHDGGDELRVSIENITHGHFADYDASSSDEATAHVVADVVAFLMALFDDRVLLWRAFGGTAGGWRVYESREAIPRRGLVSERFVWSGPMV